MSGMNLPLTEQEWQALSARLSAPFAPDDVDFRPQGKASLNGNVQVVCYVDARTVMARLDEACGPGGWSFSWEPVVVERGAVLVAKGSLTIHGVTRQDVGEASNFDPSKGCVSDTLKRCAVHFGVGRYLYDVERTWVKANGDRIDAEVVQQLRARLARRGATPAPAAKAPTTPVKPGQPTPEMRARLDKFHATLVISEEQMAKDRAMNAEELLNRFSDLERLYKSAKANGTLRTAAEYDALMAAFGTRGQ